MPGASPQNKIKFFIPNDPRCELLEGCSRIPAVFGVSPPIEYTFVL